MPFELLNFYCPVADARGGGAEGPCPPPALSCHKKDGHQRRPYRFCFSPPSARPLDPLLLSATLCFHKRVSTILSTRGGGVCLWVQGVSTSESGECTPHWAGTPGQILSPSKQKGILLLIPKLKVIKNFTWAFSMRAGRYGDFFWLGII